ncbi:putative HTH-type transcriptional regulator [Zhongshania aliphaticivorans]|uniref:Putative HTH-type transcriptional regulator n=1 Tax=Zhongshania aliphaticivorans TaxID=1470434 RepID=A0A5S9NSI4_9GAMM|nr:AraC family transcriptional regulator [Zhongshania aliphaticivorans]CAA0093549.1 putative HTH-type transcriptional regulator [Zhongshania aliphaticivorans]CAA0111513.1 putative HTH-type transcriptional regulator [Zhongshania aliphaticivorans]
MLQSVGLSRSVIKEIHLAYVDDANHEKYEKHFDCPIVMGQPCNAFLYDSSLLDQDLPWSPNQRTVDACLESCRELLNEIRRNNNFSAKIVDQIISNPRKFPSIVEIAQELSLSTRSLRRKLQHEGTSYQDILKEVRLKLAKQYLKDSFTVEQTADLLGYSESSAFSRAFKSWTGRTPQDYRISSMSSS